MVFVETSLSIEIPGWHRLPDYYRYSLCTPNLPMSSNILDFMEEFALQSHAQFGGSDERLMKSLVYFIMDRGHDVTR